MERSRLIALVAGLALLGGAIVLLRNETELPKPKQVAQPVRLDKYVDPRIDYRDAQSTPAAPNLRPVRALDLTSLRLGWDPVPDAGGYEVRWGQDGHLGNPLFVATASVELTGLDPAVRQDIEVRTVDALGRRSTAQRTTAAPREVLGEDWAIRLISPQDHFDGPAALDAHRWRLLGHGYDSCLWLDSSAGRTRVFAQCAKLDMQSTTPLILNRPDQDGALGRAVLITDGPSPVADLAGNAATSDKPAGNKTNASQVDITLAPDPFQDIDATSPPEFEPTPAPGGYVVDPATLPGTVRLRITATGVGFVVGPGVPLTSIHPQAVEPVSATPGVRHQWELRVLRDSVAAYRDGALVAVAPVAVPWAEAVVRLGFRNPWHTLLDSFGVGGVPTNPVVREVIDLGTGAVGSDSRGGGAPNTRTYPLARDRVAGAQSVRVVVSSASTPSGPLVAEFAGRTQDLKPLLPANSADVPTAPEFYTDFVLSGADPGQQAAILVHAPDQAAPYGVQAIVVGRPQPTRPAPLTVQSWRQRDHEPVVARPIASFTDEHGTPVAAPTDGGKLHVTVTADALGAQSRTDAVAGAAGVEVDLDGHRMLTLPTTADGPAVGGVYQFALDTKGLAAGEHGLELRIRPEDGNAAPTRTALTFRLP
ncbi:fibronectin type III domain-containing protein [Solihabitans fulvus]|uniref:Fibronectin type III domain-containing protein n=1 Tax=Solihabitans fulvus TaxID=1892852 RepID=A0A5B2XGG8_9PSEU|nr:fibronectin type III domain-containing protein [Solihabitans fulvus]KAA2262189.1 fibronectin type III domain-containing protein [Solihabitans fulvus]